jgi:pyrroloquinoline quinone biosynthesis protein B
MSRPVVILTCTLCMLIAACRPALEVPVAPAPEPEAREPVPEVPADEPFVVVLGIAQDAGIPQAGAFSHPGWEDPSLRRRVVSLGLVDPRTGRRWIFEATPDFRDQLYALHRLAPRERTVPDGIFLTHAHIGHYTGLMFLGHESIGADGVPVYALPKLRAFLSKNGPWDQLVRYGNVELRELVADRPVELEPDLRVTAFLVPHRQEYSEVAGFRIDGPGRSVLFLPDIDSWEEWDAQGTRIEDLIAAVDVAYLDASFYANGEIPGRDMSGFPHPFIRHSMERFADLPASEKAKVRFLHLNHTNPAQYADSEARAEILAAGFRVAEQGEVVRLGK